MRAAAEWIRRNLADGPPARMFGLQLVLLAATFVVRGVRWESPAFVACAALLLPGATRRAAAAVALGFHVLRIYRTPLVVPNHEFLEAAVLALLAIVPTARDPASRALFRRALMGMAVLLVLASGVQKLAHGHYLRGDFFAVSYAQPQSKFSTVMRRLLGEVERAEVQAFHEAFRAHVEAAAPGVLDLAPPRPPAVRRLSAIACWVTLLAELVLPLLLIPRFTRRAAAVELAVFFAAVIALSGEWAFGALFAILLLPFFASVPAGFAGGIPRAPGHPHAAAVAGCAALLAVFALWPLAHIGLVRTLDLNPWKLGGFGMYSIPARLGTVRVETRAEGDPRWRPTRPRGEAEIGFYYRRDFALRNAPFVERPARELAEHALSTAPRPPEPAAARVRSLTMAYDRTIDRFRLVERIYELDRASLRR